jgi:Flp pilus assembly protein TadG
MMKQIKKYIRETGGAIMVAFALMAPIVIGSAGMALDYAQAYLVQQRLAQAIDAAALAGAASSTDEDVVEQKVRDFFEKNYSEESLGITFEPEVHIVDGRVQVTGSAYYNTFFLNLIGIEEIDVSAYSEVTRSIGTNIELALVLDVSNSMNSNSKIFDLRDAAQALIDIVVYDNQDEFYSKVAIVPYSVAVNVGSAYAASVRGPTHGPTTSTKSITGITRANPAVVTASNHGFENGDKIYIRNVSGMTQINNNAYTVANKTTNTFQLRNAANTANINSSTYSNYSSGGAIYCMTPSCNYLYFQSPSSTWNNFAISTCVSERTGDYAYTDDPPSTAYVGRVYAASGNPCIGTQILPLTNDKTVLTEYIEDIVASGSTGGQVGVGWGWYLLSPNFSEGLWSDESQPAAYGTENLHKIVVLMTDGEYNSPYCNGVIAADATSGSGSTSDHINCNATNGNSYTQAETMCDAMKESPSNIEIYTIGFRVDDYPRGEELMEYCATDSSHFYTADDGDELQRVFEAIANNVTAVYLSR